VDEHGAAIHLIVERGMQNADLDSESRNPNSEIEKGG
jgi:hypothetical protein